MRVACGSKESVESQLATMAETRCPECKSCYSRQHWLLYLENVSGSLKFNQFS